MMNTEQRKQEPKPGCVIWLRCATKGGYGQRGHQRKNWYVHRLSWTLENGPIPPGLFVLHHCDEKRCFNVEHLFLGTQADNLADMVRKGRSAYGARNGQAKLSDVQVAEIRADPRSQRRIAKEYGIVQQHVSALKTGFRRGVR